MNPALFVTVADANYAPILALDGPAGTNLIQDSYSAGGFTGYITGNLTPPGGSLYICRLNANGSFLVNQSKQASYTSVLFTFLGWAIPS